MGIKKYFSKYKNLRRILYLLFISLSFCLTAGEIGMLSTLPFAVFIPFAATFFYYEPLSAAAIAALSAAAVSIASGKPLTFIFLYFFAAAASTLLLSFVARFVITAVNIRRIVRVSLSSLLLFSLCIAYFFTFGNPLSALISKNDARDYLADTYPSVSFSIENTSFNTLTRRYEHTVSFYSLGESRRATLSLGDLTNDGYFQYVTGLDITRCRTKLMKLLRTVTNAPLTPYSIISPTVSADKRLSPDGNNTFLDDKICHYVAFDFETPSETDFKEACEPLVKAILSSDFPFTTITFYGGLGTRTNTFLYELTLTPQSDVDAAYKDVKPFDKKSYEALQKS